MGYDANNSRFPATRWTMVARVRTTDDEQLATQALERLCEDYWYPLYAYARRKGNSPEDAQDLTQGFFAYALARNLFASAEPTLGKLRTFLLTAFDRYTRDVKARAAREKRGGTREFVSLDAGEARYAEEPLDLGTPVKLFERTWALTLLDVAIRCLRAAEAKAGRCDAFRALEPFLTPDSQGEADYAAAADQLGIGVDAARHAVKRLREKFREVLRRQIADTLNDPSKAQIDEELGALRAALLG